MEYSIHKFHTYYCSSSIIRCNTLLLPGMIRRIMLGRSYQEQGTTSTFPCIIYVNVNIVALAQTQLVEERKKFGDFIIVLYFRFWQMSFISFYKKFSYIHIYGSSHYFWDIYWFYEFFFILSVFLHFVFW